jgi:protein ImuB
VPVRTLVVLCPDWPLVAAGLAGVPSACVHAGRVVACTAEARHEGVRPGQRRRQAEGLCSGLEVVQADPARDARMFEQLVTAIAAFTPRVEVSRPGVCSFPTRGPARYFGGERALVAKIVTAVDTTLRRQADAAPACSVGIADGPFAAGLAAEEGMIVERGGTAKFLAPRPVASLGIPELSDLLHRLGIRTLGDLGKLAEEAVTERFGAEGKAAWCLARGKDDRSLALSDPPPDLAVQRELDPPADRVDEAAFVAVGLAAELNSRLAALELACTRLRVELETEHGETLARLWRADRPFVPRTMVDRVRWQLEGWLAGSLSGLPLDGDRPSAGIAVLRLAADEVIRDHGRQLGFWGEASDADRRAEQGLARVQGLLGHQAVATAVPHGGRSPVEQVRLVPWGDPRGGATPGLTAPWPGKLPGPSPALVHPRAVDAVLVDEAGELVRVSGRGQLSAAPSRCGSEEVVGWAGPWPVDERWWDAASHRRRARLQVVLEGGAAHLLALEDGQWHVEATYD